MPSGDEPIFVSRLILEALGDEFQEALDESLRDRIAVARDLVAEDCRGGIEMGSNDDIVAADQLKIACFQKVAQ